MYVIIVTIRHLKEDNYLQSYFTFFIINSKSKFLYLSYSNYRKIDIFLDIFSKKKSVSIYTFFIIFKKSVGTSNSNFNNSFVIGWLNSK